MAVPPLAEMPSVVLLAWCHHQPQPCRPGVADANGAAGIAAAVDVADGDRAAIGGSGRNAAVTSRSGIVNCISLRPPYGPPRSPSTLIRPSRARNRCAGVHPIRSVLA